VPEALPVSQSRPVGISTATTKARTGHSVHDHIELSQRTGKTLGLGVANLSYVVLQGPQYPKVYLCVSGYRLRRRGQESADPRPANRQVTCYDETVTTVVARPCDDGYGLAQHASEISLYRVGGVSAGVLH
jgi:hypothetical protein